MSLPDPLLAVQLPRKATSGEVSGATDGNIFISPAQAATMSGAVVSVAGRTGVVVLTKTDVGLASADNTADLAKPISVLTQTALDGKQPIDADLTAIAALTPTNNDVIQRKSGAWTNRTPAQLKTDLALTKADVGLSNVDNTSDLAKPISTATQTALDGKQDAGAGVSVDGVWVSGAGSTIVNGFYYRDGLVSFRPRYRLITDADITIFDTSGGTGGWQIASSTVDYYVNATVEVNSFPWQSTGWVADTGGINPIPTVTQATVDQSVVSIIDDFETESENFVKQASPDISQRVGFAGPGLVWNPSRAGFTLYEDGMHRFACDGGDSVCEVVNMDYGPNGASAFSFGYPNPSGVYRGKVAMGYGFFQDVWNPTGKGFGFIEMGTIVEAAEPCDFYVVNTNNFGAPNHHYPQFGVEASGEIMMNSLANTSMANHAFRMKTTGEIELQAGSNTYGFTLLQNNSRTAGWGFQSESSTGALYIARYGGTYSAPALTIASTGNVTLSNDLSAQVGTFRNLGADTAQLMLAQNNNGAAGWTVGALNSGNFQLMRVGAGSPALSLNSSGVATFSSDLTAAGVTGTSGTFQQPTDVAALTLLQSNSGVAGWTQWADNSGNFKLTRIGGASINVALGGQMTLPSDLTVVGAVVGTVASLRPTTDVASLTLLQQNSPTAGWNMWADNSGNFKLGRNGGATPISVALGGTVTLSGALDVGGTITGTVANTPAGNISSTTVQAAINELDSEKAASASPSFTGTASFVHIDGAGSTPSIAAGAGAGTGPTISVVGTDTAGEITITTGTLPTLNAAVVTVTFASSYASSPYVVLWPAEANASAVGFLPYVTATTTTFVVSNAISLGFAGTTTYKYNYHVIQ